MMIKVNKYENMFNGRYGRQLWTDGSITDKFLVDMALVRMLWTWKQDGKCDNELASELELRVEDAKSDVLMYQKSMDLSW